MQDGEMHVEVSGEGDFSMESENAWMVDVEGGKEYARVYPANDGKVTIEVNGEVVHPLGEPSHRLVVIGGMGESRAYLDVDTEVAILRFCAAEGIEVRHGTEPRAALKEAGEHVDEFAFSDEFWTYHSASLEDVGK